MALIQRSSGKVVKTYPISAGLKGQGNTLGSNKTPSGFLVVKSKHGDGAKKGEILKARQATGKIAKINQPNGEKDPVTTRALWLEGASGQTALERYIYIHGTPEENKLGKVNNSDGCIRMSNTEVIDLFDTVPEGTLVYIPTPEKV